MMCSQMPIRSRRAFTLIEVLMAAFIIGLGVLGLAALFAGAAFQQQISSEITASITLSRSAEAEIASQIGTLRPECSVANPDGQYVPGVWYPLTTSGASGVNPEVGMLTADPSGNDEWYFATKPNQVMPRQLYSIARPYVGGIDGRQLTSVELDSSNGVVRDFGQPRVLADSCTIEVTLASFPCDPDTGGRNSGLVNRDVLRFTYVPTSPCPTPGELARFEYTQGGSVSFIEVDLKRLEQSGDPNASIVNMYIDRIDRGTQPFRVDAGGNWDACNTGSLPVLEEVTGGITPDGYLVSSPPGNYAVVTDFRGPDAFYNVNATTGLVAFQPGGSLGTSTFAQIGSGSGFSYVPGATSGEIPVRAANYNEWFIDNIELLDFRWRNSEIATLSQRVRFQSDPSAPNGRRPVMAYAAMFRRLEGTDITQLVIFTYAVNAGSARAEFVPPETLIDITQDRAPLRAEQLDLFYDDEDQSYYVVSSGDQADWMIEPGQLLLFEGTSAIAGSDSTVRIIRRRIVDGEVRGYLERGPRIAGASLLEGQANGARFSVWSIQPTIRSVTDSSTWTLKPIEARILQIAGN